MPPDSTDLSDITGTRDKGVGTGRCTTVTGAAKGCRLQASGIGIQEAGRREPTADSRQPKEVKAHRGTVAFDKVPRFLYDYQYGVWTYGVLINP